MKIVGKKLEDWALNEADISLKDDFGRSAFNRFYYATFLTTREMLGALNAKWIKTSHKAIPDLLEGKVKQPVKRRLDLSLKKGLITAGKHSSLLTGLNISTSELANLLRKAYDIRCIADYEPEIRIRLDKKNIILSNCKLTSACTWYDRANQYCSTIRKVWSDIGLA